MSVSELKRTHRYKYNQKRRYLPGLDGFRAIAVLAIIMFHLNPLWLPGGFLGVDTFFVISGYLITSLLLSEYTQKNHIDLVQFWLRRVKRLIPAVFFMITIVVIYTILFEPQIFFSVKKDAIAAIFYVSNWWYIFEDVDYFNQFAIEPFKHLWSLAIEEQFYLFYPLILLICLKVFKKKTTFFIILAVSLLSLILMIALSFTVVDHNYSRLYFGTDTRLQTLLLGSLLAFIWPPFNLSLNIPKKQNIWISLIGLFSIAGLILLFFFINNNDTWLYMGGFYLISVLTLLIIASSVLPSGIFAMVLGNKLFTYIGKRSYSMYLWHYPIIVFLHSHFVNGQIPFYVYIIDIVLILIMTEISYHFIENPIRKHGFKAFSITPKRLMSFVRLSITTVLTLATVLFLLGAFDGIGEAHKEKKKETSFTTHNQTSKSTQESKDNESKSTEAPAEDFDIEKAEPLLIGDSVMVDIGDIFHEKVPNATIDGQVGRQLIDVPDLVDSQYQSFNSKDSDVVLELGTNGDFTKEQLETLLARFKKANVYLVNVRVPREYESHVNALMAEAAKKHKNVHLIDWYSASEGHTDYFAYDGIHLEYEGSKALSDLIQSRIKKHHETATSSS
ncbi:acyltransferase [Staphylococcus felis]|uniref:acyltransferase family protein n=1 Tax=Staphylococcus felis TaxID=46127 RepID=UPI000E244535|nr:acyltransferase family protein [Staphylococcus felis]REH78188.1 acyltransferase [Staphylococcus felis]REI11607.1 acyltransferase [Staphylococcus felis]REI28293.1 acyltransferase [Staphylococcus felis]